MPYGPIPRHPNQRIWSKVDQRAPDDCWEWQGARDAWGYGFLHAGPLYHVELRWVRAHRVAWESHNGQPVPDGLFVLHVCDNPPCCNPAHLYAGTKKNNAQDRADRKRGREHRDRGELHYNAKLTEVDVRAIIAELQKLPRRSQAAIAKDFGIKQPQVSRIMRRESWAHLWE